MVTLEDDLNRFSPTESCRIIDDGISFDEFDDNDSALLIDDGQFEMISSSLSDEEHSSDQIEEIFQTKNKEKLIDFAKSFGLFEIRYRKQIWPLLIDSSSSSNFNDEFDQNQIISHRFYKQVRLDVERTLLRFPPNLTDNERNELQEDLIVVVIKTLIKQNHLNYYQGYHDICLIFLMVLGKDLCLPLIESITKTHFKDFMGPTMEKTRDLLSYLMPLINSIHSECAEYLQKGGVGNVMFALSWFITWYSHVLDNVETILRLADLFVVSHFLMPVYVAAEIVRFFADQVLSVDCDMPSLHQFLTRLPSEIDCSTWEEIIRRSLNLFDRHRPETLDKLNENWIRKCENFDKIPSEIVVDPDENSGALPRIVLWGVTLTISGLAIYIWNHSQRTDPTTFISLGDFLAQLYRH